MQLTEVNRDSWLSDQFKLDCYNIYVESPTNAIDIEKSNERACYVTVNATAPLPETNLPLVDTFLELELKTGTSLVSSDITETLDVSTATQLGQLLSTESTSRWLQEKKLPRDVVENALRTWGENFVPRCRVVRGVIRDGEVVSVAALAAREDSSLYVDQLITASAFAGKGLARAVLGDAVLEALRVDPNVQLKSGVSIDNTASLRVHERLGFVEIGRRYVYASVLN